MGRPKEASTSRRKAAGLLGDGSVMCAATYRSGAARQRLTASCEMVVLPVPISPIRRNMPRRCSV